jgi:Kef-type K+ transport system membrane component KefB
VSAGSLFLQVALVVATCRVATALVARVHQPAVIGQMLAGVIIGPSLLGLLAPNLETLIFPTSSLNVLKAFGLVGISLYMFGVGAELDLDKVRSGLRVGAAVSAAGTIVPLMVGAAIALPFASDHRFFGPAAPRAVAVLFLAASLAVTAFPVMARILTDQGLIRTRLASLSLICGCFSDACAWCLLAVVLAGMAGSYGGALVTMAGAAGLVVFTLGVVRPLMKRFAAGNGIGVSALALELVLLMLVSWAADVVGVHPAFGAFLVGLAMPRSERVLALNARLRPAVQDLLLPFFFASAGLNTRLGLVGTPELVLLAVAMIVVATVAKGVSSGVAAHVSGMSARDSLAVGALMNARGLVEIVLITIGLERQVITPTLFSVLVLLTLVTTLLPSPVLAAMYGRPVTHDRRSPSPAPG